MEQAEAEKEDSDDSDDSADFDESDPTTEFPKFPCPFCMSSFDKQDNALTHVEQCEETEPDQNINIKEVVADGGNDWIMNMEEEKPSCPFCEKSYQTKEEVEKHILIR